MSPIDRLLPPVTGVDACCHSQSDSGSGVDEVRYPIEVEEVKGRKPPSVPLVYTTRELANVLRVSVRTIERMVARGDLPPRLQISAQRKVWLVSDIMVWLENLPRVKY